MQIKKLADELGVQVTLVKNFLRTSEIARGRVFAGAEEDLDRDQERAVRDAHQANLLKRNRGATIDVEVDEDAPDPEVNAADLEGLRAAVVERWPLLARGMEAHAIFAHEDVLRWLVDPTTPMEQRKILTRRIQELMAHGHATRMKSVKGKNAGWLRTPLGGNSGNQYYLWLTNHGDTVRGQEAATRELHHGMPPRSRFLRAVRHHDATKEVLDVGTPSDFVRLEAQRALEGAVDDGLVEPLVEAQRAVVDDRTRVRVLVGRPGAGKTTALQAAASTLKGRALYVTWSPALAARAKEWFAAFGPGELEIEVWTFRELLARVDPSRSLPAELSLPVAVEELRTHAEPILGSGPWRHRGELRAEELYAELHAHLIGAAMPVAFSGRRACSAPTLADADYRALRDAIGPKAIEGALLVLRKLPSDVVQQLFAAPVAAFERARDLQRGTTQLDPSFAFDWVLVDEVQDLTLAEQWLLVDVAARSGRSRGVIPGMVVAGDEAQTVRPTAFEFAPLSTMIEQRLGARTERKRHELAQNLRSPETIAKLVDRADDVLYGLLPRVERPRGRRSDTPGDVTVGRVATVAVADEGEVRRVLETFKELAGEAALVYPAALVPGPLADLASEVGVTLWTSETIKGLEFRTVGVLETPREVARVVDLATSTKDSALSIELARSAVDRLLVALSRSTETLVLIGDRWSDAPDALAQILEGAADPIGDVEAREGNLGRVDLADLPELLELDAADTVARIEAQLTSSQRFQDLGQHADAVREAENARGLLGPAGRPGSAGKELRQRTHRRLALANAAHALTGGPLKLLRVASRAFRASDAPMTAALTTALAGALERPIDDAGACERLLEVVRGLGQLGVEEPSMVEPVVQMLRRRVDSLDARNVPRQPAARAALVAALASLAADAPTDREAFRATHQRVLDHVLRSILGKTDKAHRDEFAALRVGVADPAQLALLDAEHAEACGDVLGAAARWEQAGRLEDALRCWRSIPDFKEAGRVAAAIGSPDAAMLGWAREMDIVLAARPSSGALTDAERAHLRKRMEHLLAVAHDAQQRKKKR
ncbi:MAG: hypothetical protein U0234_32875 [Sandaracinus sp.]